MLSDIAFRSIRDIGKFGQCGSQVVAVKITVLKNLAKLEMDLCPFRSGTVKAEPSHHVLSHVEDGFSGGCVNQRNGPEFFLNQDARVQTGLQFRFVQLNYFRVQNLAAVDAGLIDFTGIDAAACHRASAGLPVRIRADRFHTAICIEELQLGNTGQTVSVELVVFPQAVPALIPAVAQQDFDAVMSLDKVWNNCLVGNPCVIVAEAGH